ncbi:periplasmic sensor signal transduction histidine kinase [Candidatus Koribacter versatilis Ellin345]|uniref:histidine kinase n=1 Tax=Koribacter versatilis (strain Ellin345) TaxID=204669 RepID=Q1IIV4_KORVE|nr:ATP-binding protein [Candidatus Koribacter versatilis]ABF43196.1 periplasmic sensor signal transduction histidine kinase [Candidatus Koribacter versatilis Ellin345]
MQELFRHLPSPLILGTLVGIFFSIYRHNRTSRVRFWLLAWILIFLHFVVPIVTLTPTRFDTVIAGFDAATLQLAGLAFIFSLVPLRLTERVRWYCFFGISIPIAIYSALWITESTHKLPQAICVSLVSLGGVCAYHYFCINRDWVDNVVEFSLVLLGFVSVYQIYYGNVSGPYHGIMTGSYALAGVFVIRHYWRKTPGVLVTSGGLFAWSFVWALAAYLPNVVEKAGEAASDLWNVPKLVVAFGMILILLEDESIAAQDARDREHALNHQVERFAEITSQLLGAVDVPPFCEKIANVITEEGNFHRVVVLLADDSHHLHIAGNSGLSPEALAHVQQIATKMSLEEITRLCLSAPKIGKNSYVVPAERIAAGRFLRSGREYPVHPRWRQGDELLVPLQSHRGLTVGCFFLDDPKDLDRIGWEELSKIELLAADLAVAIDRTSMHRQMIQREKLVGIGQLVSGVAHELNNPLTAVLGYTELMGDYNLQPEVARDLTIVRREANRMKRIIENLLRFSRQSRSETTTTDFNAVLQDVLTLREYDLNGRGIKIATNVPAQLPNIAIDQSQLKIVLSNLIANAIDAVQERPTKEISLEVRDLGDKLLVNITDSGPGFADLNRIFDPFFTTKSPGRGMGLGLSICYGIMRQHGGEIYAANVHPQGACISIEVPTVAALRVRPVEVVS